LDRQSRNARSGYGISKEKTEGENLQTQTPQAYAGESPQEALALQSLNFSLVRPQSQDLHVTIAGLRSAA